MLVFALPPLWAVHISDVLAPAWVAGGFALAALLLLLGGWGMREEEIPQTALLASAFFVASQIHVRVGPSSVHLLLNGLVGVVLGRRAALAIFAGLCLQYVLFFHGSLSALGVNTCVMTIPALVVGQLFVLLHRRRWVQQRWFSTALVFGSSVLLVLSVVFCAVLLWDNGLVAQPPLKLGLAGQVVFHPVTLIGAALLGVGAVCLERRLENTPEFALGFLLGETAVLLTLGLAAVALVWGGLAHWHTLAVGLFLLHLPIAVIEGVVLGFMVGFLTRVKPELLGLPAAVAEPSSAPQSEEATCEHAPLA
jgi:cobalt/nickel transport system permease protein